MATTTPSQEDYIAANSAIDGVLDPDAQLGGADTAPPGLIPLNLPNQNTLEDTANGFYAQAYSDIATGDVIIAFDSSVVSATDPRNVDDPTYSAGSLAADGLSLSEGFGGLQGIAEDVTPEALKDAAVFAGAVRDFVAAEAISNLQPIPSIYVTGFSLGGAKAEEAALNLTLGPGGIAGGETFGAPGLPNYPISSTANSTVFVNYVNYGDAVGNYAKDTELAEVSFTGYHFGAVQYVGNSVDQSSLRTATDLLKAGLDLAGAALWTGQPALLAAAAGAEPALAQAIEQIYQETIVTHSLTAGIFSYAEYVASSLVQFQQAPRGVDFASSYLPQIAQVIAAKTQPTGLPLPPPTSSVYSVTPNTPSVAEDSGTLSFTITRTDTSQAATVYVSTIQDQGSVNPNGNYYYDGLLNDKVTFAAGVATAQVPLTINDQQLASGSETFRLAVQQNATDPIGT
ncbi:MAG: hypothetical protein P4N59_30980 [Negativicutes bacterium]|nr:hypothetical protein [Negativicutes bacterium]